MPEVPMRTYGWERGYSERAFSVVSIPLWSHHISEMGTPSFQVASNFFCPLLCQTVEVPFLREWSLV